MKKMIIMLLIISSIFVSGSCSREKSDGSTGSRVVAATADNPSWSQDKTPYTLTWFVAYDWYGKTWNPKQNLGDKYLLERTGITLEITVGNYDKLNMLIVTHGLPDMVTFDAVASQRKLLENGGVLLDLEELAAKYAPDLNVPQSMKNWYRADDGKWYGVASYYSGPERGNPEYGGFQVTHNLNYARQDILEQIGMTLDDLKTKSGFINALRAVRDKNIRYNGRTVVPFVGAYPDALAAQFGADLEDPEGNMVNIRRTPEYLEALLYMNTMFNEGLITDEQFTENSTQRDQRVAAGHVFSALGWMTVQYPRKSLFNADPNAKMLYAGVINGGDSGKTPILESSGTGGWTVTMITKNAKNPAKAIQFMSYMTSEKATLDSFFLYDTYDIIDGKAVQNPLIKKELDENYTAAAAKYNMNIDFFVDYKIIQKFTGLDPDALYYDIDLYYQERDTTLAICDNKAFTFVNPDDGTELAVAKIRIDDYWNRTWPSMIMARNADECIRMYHEAIAQADSMGMKNLDAYQNGQFLNNKKRLGVTRVWPR